jgi:hypothetical protein
VGGGEKVASKNERMGSAWRRNASRDQKMSENGRRA